MNPFDSAVSLAQAVRSKQVSPVEIAQEYLRRIDRYDPEINAFVWRNDEEVLQAAKDAEDAVMSDGKLPAFHGVPIPVKDFNSVAGQPNTYGSVGVSDAPRTETDLSIERLQQSGFLLMGRTNAPEMGPMSVTENQRYGITRNPWDLRLSPGGSSGGGAAAVAGGLAPVAQASDGGGSIRMPSSACGLVGLKPSRGRVPMRVPAWEHSATDGAVTRHVEDAAALLDVMSVPDLLGWYHAPVPERPFAEEVGRETGRLRVGLLVSAPTGVPVDDECVAAAKALAHVLEGLGHDVSPVEPRFFSLDAARAFVDLVVPAALHLTPYDDPDLAEPYLQVLRAQALSRNSAEYAQGVALLHLESREIIAQWGRDFDVLLTPTMACTPPPAGTVVQDKNADPTGFRMTETQMISFTFFANLTGLPAISLPVHRTAAGVPVGAQLVGAPFDEACLIRLASAVESVFGWTTTLPDAFR
ncbi:amidase [Streptomyces flaveus]|uniref:6-aminohexanoate-cyclic-dimer hydrolase n=1 Tax=Streptomyces flaveus TaxID=66370 RepID=A0A917RD39_9ACTN|nr:amidase [Streptomyces flaveus]GGL01766.1 6-aminohexanoate-cyclic-dimer hydrolase [Streptomyces flaveus]